MQSPHTLLCLKPGGGGGGGKGEKTKIESKLISVYPLTLFYLKSYKKVAINWYGRGRGFLGCFGCPLQL